MISVPKTVTTTCPHCGNYTLEIHMNANTSSGFTHGNCTKCHYQPSAARGTQRTLGTHCGMEQKHYLRI